MYQRVSKPFIPVPIDSKFLVFTSSPISLVPPLLIYIFANPFSAPRQKPPQ